MNKPPAMANPVQQLVANNDILVKLGMWIEGDYCVVNATGGVAADGRRGTPLCVCGHV